MLIFGKNSYLNKEDFLVYLICNLHHLFGHVPLFW